MSCSSSQFGNIIASEVGIKPTIYYASRRYIIKILSKSGATIGSTTIALDDKSAEIQLFGRNTGCFMNPELVSIIRKSWLEAFPETDIFELMKAANK